MARWSWRPRDEAPSRPALDRFDEVETPLLAHRAAARVLAGVALEGVHDRLFVWDRLRRSGAEKSAAQSEALLLDPIRKEAVATQAYEALR